MNGRNETTDNLEEAGEEAKGAITETAQRVRDAAVEAGGKAQEIAAEAGRQASAAAQTAYTTSNEVIDLVEDVARQNIWTSLLIAGAVGYGLACVVKNGR